MSAISTQVMHPVRVAVAVKLRPPNWAAEEQRDNGRKKSEAPTLVVERKMYNELITANNNRTGWMDGDMMVLNDKERASLKVAAWFREVQELKRRSSFVSLHYINNAK